MDLFLKRGPFWKAIRAARDRLDVTPAVRVPPKEVLSAPIRHYEEALKIHDDHVPEAYRRWFSFDWLGFVDTCIDFHPPGDGLVRFAAFFGEPFETRLIPRDRKLGPVGDLPGMVAPPIKRTRNADGSLRYEITFEDQPTEDDVRLAARMMKHAVGAKVDSSQRHRERDPLVCIEASVLYDDQNGRDFGDQRKRTWTFEKIADRYNLPSARAARQHIEEGQRLRRQSAPKP